MTDQQWDALGIPIGLAFFFFSTPIGQIVSVYPSPAGGTESLLPADSWELLCRENPALGRLKPDVEALLVNRIRGAREYYRAPIDECFKLVGLIRTHWRGLSGGKEAWEQIAQYFVGLKAKANVARADA